MMRSITDLGACAEVLDDCGRVVVVLELGVALRWQEYPVIASVATTVEVPMTVRRRRNRLARIV